MKGKVLGIALALAVLLAGCRDGAGALQEGRLQDGYYTAEMTEFNEDGWKEYLTIYVMGGLIVKVEYDAKDQSGFIKSWDMEYMRSMNLVHGTYSTKFGREYTEALINRQDPEKVDAVAGATRSHTTFQLLAEAAIQQSIEGNKNVVFVDVPGVEDE